MQLKWNGRNYRPAGNLIRVYKPDINELIKPASQKKWNSVILTGQILSGVSGGTTPVPPVSPSLTPTNTPTPSVTPTNTPTTSLTPTNTPTETNTPTPSITASETPTQTPSETPTNTPTLTPTETPTETPTNTPSETPTLTPSETPTNTPSETPTNTPSPTTGGLACLLQTENGDDIQTEGSDNLEPESCPSVTPSPTPSITPTETPTNTPTPSATLEPSGTTEAKTYLAAVLNAGGTGITPTVSAATITLFTSLVSNGLWDSLNVFYPVLGGVQTAHAINAKSPGTNDLVFSGGWTHNASGMTANGTNGVANTGVLHSTLGNNSHASIYNNTNNIQSGVDIGCLNGSGIGIYIQTRFTDIASQIGCKGINGIDPSGARNFANTDARGYYIVTRNSPTNKQILKNGTVQNTQSNTQGTASLPIYIGAYNANGTTAGYVNRQYSFATLGGEVNTLGGTLSTIINTFQTSLGRNIY